MNQEFKAEYKQLGLKIAYYRKLKGYTQEMLAEKININSTFLGQAEAPNVQKTISLDTLFKISEVLNVPAYRFLKFDD